MGSVEMCFKGSCDVTNEAERLSMVRLPKEEDGGVGGGGGVISGGWAVWVFVCRRKVRGGRCHGNAPWCW